jgi:hypothetical protein
MSLEDTRILFQFLDIGLASKRNVIYVTNRQMRVLQNSVYNIFFNSSLSFDEKLKKYFKRHSKQLKQLASKQVNIDVKRGIISKNRALIRKVGFVVLKYINE